MKYEDQEPLMELDRDIHRESPFFKKKMLDGVLDKFLEELNEHCEPIRDSIINAERLSFQYLYIGFSGTLFIGLIIWLMFSIEPFIGLMAFYFMTLGLVYKRTFKKTQRLL